MTLEDRLARLEQQNRVLRRAVAGMAILGFSALIAGAALPAPNREAVTARGFVVKDAAGRTRAVLGVNAKNEAGLDLYDANGRRRLLLAVGDDAEPVMAGLDENGRAKWMRPARLQHLPSDLLFIPATGRR